VYRWHGGGLERQRTQLDAVCNSLNLPSAAFCSVCWPRVVIIGGYISIVCVLGVHHDVYLHHIGRPFEVVLAAQGDQALLKDRLRCQR
jgi:hypothetical protein